MPTPSLESEFPNPFRGMSPQLGQVQALVPDLDESQLMSMYEQVVEGMQMGDPGRVLELAFSLVDASPWERAYRLILAECLQQLGEYESAGRFYGLALMLDATDALCAYRMGECLGALGHLDDAREAFDTAVKLSWLDPHYADVREAAQAQLDAIVGATE